MKKCILIFGGIGLLFPAILVQAQEVPVKGNQEEVEAAEKKDAPEAREETKSPEAAKADEKNKEEQNTEEKKPESEPAVDENERLFTALDTNGDGKISADEIGEERKRFFERLLSRGDKDADGQLSREEFQNGLKEPARPQPQGDNPRPGRQPDFARLAELDANKDGKITLEEVPERFRERLKPIFERLGREEIPVEQIQRLMGGQGGAGMNPEQQFEAMDQNKDGMLTLDEVEGRRKQMLEGLFTRLQKGKDDSISKEEYVRSARGPQQGGNMAGNLFDTLDANKDGKLTTKEVEENGNRMALQVYRQLEIGEDEEVTREEFLAGMRRLMERGGGQFNQRPSSPRFFTLLDADSSGKLSKDELAKAAEMLEELDANKDGELEPQELFGFGPGSGGPPGAGFGPPRNPMRRPAEQGRPPLEGTKPETEEKPEATEKKPDAAGNLGQRFFNRFDKDKDGKISEDEAPERLKGIFKRLDSNGDGGIDAKELETGMERTRNSQPKRKDSN